ncbi:ABC transporter substrate-binding protein [Pelistega sp. MC2]|uniref:ABC transporter substrate-binding protein n=1 Tax=Pelistega sp. MC2 TaxID=1720297 RepID=UPI0008D94C77|nr:ABC transporter substrate-binding protein [Pelistega sp. MC2]
MFNKLLTALGLAVLSVGAQAQQLTLYTSQPVADAQMTVEAFEKANPGVKVEWVRDGTTKLMTKFRAEVDAGVIKPDLLLIADSVTLEQLKKENLLEAYDSAEKSHYDASLYDNQGFYYGTKLITTGIAYHKEAKDKPTSWNDLLKPEYKDLAAMPSPLYSGAALIHLSALTTNPEFGWKYYEGLKANGMSPQKGNGSVLTAITSGAKPYGVLVDYLAIREKAKGAPVEFVFPTEGVSMVTEPIAILKSSKNKELAKKFVDFVLSEEGQKLVLSQGYLPARNGMPSPEGFPDRKEIKLLPFDASKALENTENDKAGFSKLFE